jgi:Zn-dependent peptidase ImmA (M78 family)
MPSQKKILSDASMAAARLHARLHTDQTKPVDVFAVVQDLGIWITTQPLGSLFGFYLRQNGALGICLNARHPETLQRYTCAHELAHHVLGHGSSLDERDEVDGWGGTSSVEERAAQVFAGNFLMPLGLVNRVMRRLGLYGKPLSAPDIYQISREMDVSFTAAVWRLRTLDRVDRETAEIAVQRGAAAAKEQLRNGPPVSATRADLWTVQEAPGSAEFSCRVGDEILIQLPENRSTGRTWAIEVADDPQTMVGNEQYVSWDGGVGLELVGQDDAYVGLPSSSPLRIAEDRHIEAPTIPSESRSRSYTQSDEAIPNLDEQSWLRETLGVEGTRKIEVVADSEGEYSMHLVLRPNWTTDDEPLSTVTVSVDVRPTHQLEGFSQRQLAKILAN